MDAGGQSSRNADRASSGISTYLDLNAALHLKIIPFELFRCVMQDILSRPRRNRRSPSIRGAISETFITPSNLILPVFIHDGEQNIPISSMPGVDRLGWRHGLLSAVAEARSYGVNSVVLFPKVKPKMISCALILH